jgi:hypothetical protein
MKYFFNDEMNAPNVLKVNVDASIVQELRRFSDLTDDNSAFAIHKPQWNSDICWISPNTAEMFDVFYSIFRRLNIAAHVKEFLDIENDVQMYCGFLVRRRACLMPNFHVDWVDTNNEAFTLITPLSDNTKNFGLLYQTQDGSIIEYEYKMGEALIFGDKFIHSTKPGWSEKATLLLSITFGTDKMQHWPKIAKTAATQSNLMRLPSGDFFRGNTN